MHNSHRGQGRGRGRGQSRWRGNHDPPKSQHMPNSRQHGVWQPGPPQNGSASVTYQSSSNLQHSGAHPIPPGSYVNPNFGNPYSTSNGPQHSSELNGITNWKAGSPQRTIAGHKRKLEALRGPPRPKKQPGLATAPAVPGFGAPILPATPNATANSPGMQESTQWKQKTIRKGLGLTPATHDPQYPPPDDEQDGREIDEEAIYAELGDKLTFEHNGVIMSLNSQADLAAWKTERQKRWPTKSRMAEREEERRRIGEARKRLLASAGSLQRSPGGTNPKSKIRRGKGFGSKIDGAARDHGSGPAESLGADANAQPQTELEKTKAQLEKQTRSLDELRKKVAESKARNRKAKADMERLNESNRPNEEPNGISAECPSVRADLEEALGGAIYEDGEEENVGEDDGSDDSVLESSSDVSLDSSSESDSDDDAPEEVTSRPPPSATPGRQKLPCRYYTTSGYCRDGDSCRFGHEVPSRKPQDQNTVRPQQEQRDYQQARRNPPPPRLDTVIEKKSIFQRLKEQEQAGEDRLALQVIKYLGKAGLFADAEPEDV